MGASCLWGDDSLSRKRQREERVAEEVGEHFNGGSFMLVGRCFLSLGRERRGEGCRAFLIAEAANENRNEK